MRSYAFLLFIHVLAVVVWVGGMWVMHFAVRPSAVELLPPPQRLPLMTAALRRFFGWVVVAVLLVLASGVAMIVGYGLSAGAGEAGRSAFGEGMRMSHVSVHAMFALGLVMAVIFAFIRLVPFPRLQWAVAAQDWPAGARQLDLIRKLVATNLVLGIVTIAVATVGRALL